MSAPLTTADLVETCSPRDDGGFLVKTAGGLVASAPHRLAPGTCVIVRNGVVVRDFAWCPA